MIDNISTKDLQAELNRRQKAKQESLKPKKLSEPNIAPLQKMCQEYIDAIDTKDPRDGLDYDDFKQYIFECAVETVFGKDVWEFINSKNQ